MICIYASLYTSILLSVVVIVVIGQDSDLEGECNILLKLDSLESRVGLLESSLVRKSVRIGDLETRLNEKDAQIGNLKTAMGDKDIRIGDLETAMDERDDRIDDLETAVGERDVRLGTLETAMSEKNIRIDDLETAMGGKDVRIGNLETSLNEAYVKIDNLTTAIGEKDVRIRDIETSLYETNVQIADMKTRLNEKEVRLNETETRIDELEKQRPEPAQAVGFSVAKPRESQTTRQMNFRTVLTNEGGAFNASSGVFTCPVAGVYYFSAALLKEYNYDGYTYCRINKNGVNLVTAFTLPGHSPRLGQYAVVNGAYTRLAVGDIVTLGDCAMPIETVFYQYSSFSGFLVTPDYLIHP